jgi:hypothetical protein
LLPKPLWQIRAHFVNGAGNEIKPETQEPKGRRRPNLPDASTTLNTTTEPNFSATGRQAVEESNLSGDGFNSASETAVQQLPPESPTNTPTETATPTVPTTRSGRPIRPVTRLIEVMNATLTAGDENDYDVSKPHPLLVYAASTDPDTMYLHEALRQPDRLQFIEAMKREVEDHTKNGNWRVVHRSQVCRKICKAVWSMKRKRRIATREVYKWKARLTACTILAIVPLR